MRDRLTAALTAFFALAGVLSAPVPVAASAAPPKVVIIVGPVGSMTDSYRSQANDIAAAAAADGAYVVKVYSPRATWGRVKSAVAGANIVIYLGHGNGYPSPYSSTYNPDRVDGWGLNTSTRHGDKDSWSAGTLVYCGEKALLGTLTQNDGGNQWKWCGGASGTQGINPAAGFVMIYANACYAPGASEMGATPATATQALQRLSYYSRPILNGLDGGGYFATDHGATPLVHALLTKPDTALGDIYVGHQPSSISATSQSHLLVSGASAWLGHRSTDPFYTYAFAGHPTHTFSGGTADMELTPPPPPAPKVVGKSPTGSSVGVAAEVKAVFSAPVTGVSASTFRLVDLATGQQVAGNVHYRPLKRTGYITPSDALPAGHQFRVSLNSGIHDAAGNHLAWTCWKFTTAGG